MEFREKCARILRSIIGWFLIVLGGLWGGSAGFCAFAALFGGLEVDSFGERMRFFATALMMTVAFFTILWLGIRLKNGVRGKMTAAPVKRKSSSANQKETQQSTDERRLQREKEELLRAKRTAYAGKITVQDALNTFPAEEQQRFENQLYQYSQDTGRAGLSPEIAAANRGLVFVDGRPVAKEVAARLDEMRNAASSDNAADTGQTGQSQEEAVCVLYERNWAGQAAENGVDKIFLKVFEDECVITYERLSRNCYATPPIEDVQMKVRYRSLSTISTWSLEKLLLYINRIFHLSINLCDCCSEQHYLAWIENHNTEFYSMEIMFDGKKQACMVRRENEKFCEEIRFQGQTYFWKQSKAIHGLWYNDYAEEVCLNEKVYYLYHSEIPNKNDTLCWIVSQITESVFELLKHQPCNKEEIVVEKEIGRIGGNEPERRGIIYEVLALATGRTVGYYRADDGTRKICLDRIPETVVPNDNHS